LSTRSKNRVSSQSPLKKEIEFVLKGINEKRKKEFSFWEQLMGEKIAKVATPVKNKNGILFIKVQDATWRFELARRKQEIIDLINRHVEKNFIKDIVFI